MRDIKKEHYDKFIETSRILDWIGADENIIKHVYYEAFKDGEITSEDAPLARFPYHVRICECDNCLQYKKDIAKRMIEKYLTLQPATSGYIDSLDGMVEWLAGEE